MTYIWPPDSTGRDDLPDDPVLQRMNTALDPIRPVLRGVSFEATPGEYLLLVSFGAACHLASVRLTDTALIVDSPVGEVPQRSETLLQLLHANYGRRWTFRVDGVTQASLSSQTANGPEVVVVIEHHTSPDRLPDLAALILEVWREKLLNRALILELRGETDV